MRIDDVADVSAHEGWRRLWESDERQHPYYLPEELAAGSAHFHPVYYLPPELQYTHDPADLTGREPHYLRAPVQCRFVR
ncbi:hypothetical protein AB0K16_45250 [Nonomuraea jabiensis]|uniref:hypothetical protein n=1 Tax=Nonomuraea jabiensis TaxID=882448 RepID=UPI00344834D0